jgi:hypothetical protein
LPPFDFGPRPKELVGITSGFAIELEDPAGEYVYYGEILNTDNEIMCGKGIRVWIKGEAKAILIGWFRNNIFSGLGRNIFENNLQHYDGEFFKFKYHGKGTIKYGDKR